MTNFEKWKKKLAEAKDAEGLIYQFDLMSNEFCEKQCFPTQNANYCDEIDTCIKCKVRWLDMETEK